MNPLTTLVRSLGNERAVANAAGALAVSVREDWLVQGLTQRLARHDALRTPLPTTATAHRAA